jgi:hypothetical protein
MIHSRNDLLFISMSAGPGQFVAGPTDCACACFGWADPATGLVTNVFGSPSQMLGFILPQYGNWARIYHWNGRRYVRSGMPVTLALRGEFWVRFMAGANFGDQVYANPLDGSAISGPLTGAVVTPWRVVTAAGAGELAVISTWRAFS